MYEQPAENAAVTITALTMCGRARIPKFCMATTYGEEAPLELADVNATYFGSLYAIKIETDNAPPT